MTISYSDNFFKLLLRWKGSLWKTIWRQLLTFMIMYYAVNVVYRFILEREQVLHFQKYIILFDRYTEQIPLTFLLGFFVAMVIGRWWQQFQFISWPDRLMYTISAYMQGDGKARIMRRTIARYSILSSVLAWRSVSVRVLKRFPTEEHLLSSGLMTKQEYDMFSKTEVKIDPHKKWFIPLNWIQTIIIECHKEGRFEHTNELRKMLDELDVMRNGYFQLFLYDWVTIPLVYTQVATISVFGYFAMCLIGRQYPKPIKDLGEGIEVDIYIPFFTILQFLFYVGWLKVGEDLMFPFGSDDEDFEFNYILDRNLEISYLICDQLHMQRPTNEGGLDGYMPVEVQPCLMHTQGSASMGMHMQKKHVAKEKITRNEMDLLPDHDPYAKQRHQSITVESNIAEKQIFDQFNSFNGARDIESLINQTSKASLEVMNSITGGGSIIVSPPPPGELNSSSPTHHLAPPHYGHQTSFPGHPGHKTNLIARTSSQRSTAHPPVPQSRSPSSASFVPPPRHMSLKQLAANDHLRPPPNRQSSVRRPSKRTTS